MNSLFQLEIPKRQLSCALQGERLDTGKEIYSLLCEEDTSEKLIRRDYCQKCWKEVQPTLENISKRIYWKSKYDKKPAPPPSTRVQRALVLLRELINSSPCAEEEIFVLSLLLSHARQLILRKEIEQDSHTFHLYEVAKQDDYFTIKVMNLTASQITTLQQLLASKLNIGKT